MIRWIISDGTYINVDHIEAIYDRNEEGCLIALSSGLHVADKRTPYQVMLEVWEDQS